MSAWALPSSAEGYEDGDGEHHGHDNDDDDGDDDGDYTAMDWSNRHKRAVPMEEGSSGGGGAPTTERPFVTVNRPVRPPNYDAEAVRKLRELHGLSEYVPDPNAMFDEEMAAVVVPDPPTKPRYAHRLVNGKWEKELIPDSPIPADPRLIFKDFKKLPPVKNASSVEEFLKGSTLEQNRKIEEERRAYRVHGQAAYLREQEEAFRREQHAARVRASAERAAASSLSPPQQQQQQQQ